MNEYYPRIADKILQEELSGIGAVLLEGPKWCGKTSTSEQIAKSVLYMNNPKTKEINKIIAQSDPESLLLGETPRLIDEWQIAADQIWDTIRFTVDRRQAFGQFILTGSATPPKRSTDTHSGTGRIKRMRMRTMSLFESRDSSGEISLSSLFNNNKIFRPVQTGGKLEEIAYLVCRGGWPMAVIANREKPALKQANNYLDALLFQEIDDDSDDIPKMNPEWTKAILRSYSRLIGTSASSSVIYEDSMRHGNVSYSQPTLENYLRHLSRLFVFEDLVAWNPNLRSKTAIRTSPTRYLTDPSVAAAALGLGPGAILNDLKTFGFLFENMAIRDLRTYGQSLGAQVYHYRDHNNLECDCVIVLPDGRYALIEVKLGGKALIEEGIKSLNKLEGNLNTDDMGKPAFKMVLCAVSPYAYMDPSGVIVCPITSLRN